MLANWVKETVSAAPLTGDMLLDGAFSLDFIPFSERFADGEPVHYSAEDGNDREDGIGIYNSGANSITRTTPLETLDSGVFNDTSPTAISLTSAAIVSITPSVNNLLPAIAPQINYGADDIIYDAFTPNLGRSSRSMFNNRTYLMPFFIPFPVTLSGLGVEILTLASGAADQELGLFFKDLSSNDFHLIDRTGNVDISSVGSTGFISTTFDNGNRLLRPGMYWVGQSCNVSEGSIQGINYSNYFQHPYAGQGVDEPIVGHYADGTYSAGIPSTILEGDNISVTSGVFPLIYGVKA